MAQLLILAIIALPGVSQAQDSNFVMCKNRNIVRHIRVEIREDKSCVTKYTKAGIDREIGSGKSLGSCHNFKNNVRKNLESAGWKCRDVAEIKFNYF